MTEEINYPVSGGTDFTTSYFPKMHGLSNLLTLFTLEPRQSFPEGLSFINPCYKLFKKDFTENPTYKLTKHKPIATLHTKPFTKSSRVVFLNEEINNEIVFVYMHEFTEMFYELASRYVGTYTKIRSMLYEKLQPLKRELGFDFALNFNWGPRSRSQDYLVIYHPTYTAILLKSINEYCKANNLEPYNEEKFFCNIHEFDYDKANKDPVGMAIIVVAFNDLELDPFRENRLREIGVKDDTLSYFSIAKEIKRLYDLNVQKADYYYVDPYMTGDDNLNYSLSTIACETCAKRVA